jgi:hypothetical protein
MTLYHDISALKANVCAQIDKLTEKNVTVQIYWRQPDDSLYRAGSSMQFHYEDGVRTYAKRVEECEVQLAAAQANLEQAKAKQGKRPCTTTN